MYVCTHIGVSLHPAQTYSSYVVRKYRTRSGNNVCNKCFYTYLYIDLKSLVSCITRDLACAGRRPLFSHMVKGLRPRR